ncbi:MAG: hypothetical protein AMDU1_APLC00098G0009, partial [Thermoplasmatales archaeon A-plasma]
MGTAPGRLSILTGLTAIFPIRKAWFFSSPFNPNWINCNLYLEYLNRQNIDTFNPNWINCNL